MLFNTLSEQNLEHDVIGQQKQTQTQTQLR